MAVREESRAGSTGEILDGIHHTVKPFRILHTESSRGLGGQEYRVLHEVMGMKDRGHQVILAVQPSSQLKDRALKCGLCVEPVDMRKSRWIFLVSSFTRLISKYNIDVINTHGSIDSWTASLAGRLSRNKPLIIRTRHKSTPISNTFRHRFLYRVLPHGIVTTGQVVREAMIQNNGIEESRIVSIPTGVDLSRYTPYAPDEDLKKEWQIDLGDLVVGTVAFLRDYKGLGYFLEAARLVADKMSNVWFWIIGSGPVQKELEQQIAVLGLRERVLLTGFREDIPQILGFMDVFVLSSISAEAVPQVLTHALAMERAVVATKVGGVSEVVQDGCSGLLCPPKDSAGLADKILTLLMAPDLRARLGQTGRRIVLNSYGVESMLDKTEALYLHLMNLRSLGHGNH